MSRGSTAPHLGSARCSESLGRVASLGIRACRGAVDHSMSSPIYCSGHSGSMAPPLRHIGWGCPLAGAFRAAEDARWGAPTREKDMGWSGGIPDWFCARATAVRRARQGPDLALEPRADQPMFLMSASQRRSDPPIRIAGALDQWSRRGSQDVDRSAFDQRLSRFVPVCAFVVGSRHAASRARISHMGPRS